MVGVSTRNVKVLDALLYLEWQIGVGKGQASEVIPADGGAIYADLCSLQRIPNNFST